MDWPNEIIKQLRECWERYDNRLHLFAPDFSVYQAIMKNGKTASGAAETQAGAVVRLLGETAETEYLSGASVRFNSAQDGLAADPDLSQAQHRALLEAFERTRLSQWWQGQILSHEIDETWIRSMGLDLWLSGIRKGATYKRATRLWRLPSIAGEFVFIAVSFDKFGAEPILGYGVSFDAVPAAKKAMRELLLMEMRLVDLQAATEGALVPQEFVERTTNENKHIGVNAVHLLAKGRAKNTPNSSLHVDITDIETFLGGVRYHIHSNLSVVHCKPKGPTNLHGDDLPFYGSGRRGGNCLCDNLRH